ncbi:MAG: hypothetical protein P8Y44_06950, partial [Acidobacteriota bacterium]
MDQIWPNRVDRSWRRSTTYFDTFDWRLLAAASTLWSEEGLRSPILYLQPSDASPVLQTKISRSPGFVWDLPQGPLREFIAPVVGVRRLLDITSIRARGSVLRVLDRREKTVAMLRFERLEASTALGCIKRAELCQSVTLIPIRGYNDTFDKLRISLQKDFGLRRLNLPEHVEAARVLGLEPGGYSKKLDTDLDAATGA